MQTTSPAFNLAFEEILCAALPDNHPGYFLLWQNDPSIIISRHQITQAVVNPNFVAEKKIPVIRRNSGGGAVYHDLGNLNFSFIQRCPANYLPVMGDFLLPVCQALESLDIHATISGRNDLEYKGRKFSGSSMARIKNTILHHGTLLVNLDIKTMGEALSVDESKFRSHGVSSMRSRVVNLGEATGRSLEEIRKTLAQHCADRKAEPDQTLLQKALRLVHSKYETWDWNYGLSPKCDFLKEARFPWGSVTVKLGMKNGLIVTCNILGDFIGVAEISELEQMLSGRRFEPVEIASALKKAQWEKFFIGCDPDKMADFFVKELFR